MFKGAVNIRARITRNRLKFPSCEFNPNESGVEKVVMESPDGDEIQGTVHLTAVATDEEARIIAAKVANYYLDRISFIHGAAIETHEIKNSVLAPVDLQPGALVQLHSGDLLIFGQQGTLIVGIPAANLKAEMEQAALSGEKFFGMFRSALQSVSPIEQFMHLYQILLLLFNDDQTKIDAFILQEEPNVSQTQHPLKPSGAMETVYTRLRNEFGHVRPRVNIQNTKVEMARMLGGLTVLTKRAIELQP